MDSPVSHWIAWKQRLRPPEWRGGIDWSAEFGADRPLDLEIGFGNGMWLRAHAAEHPERNIVGMELVIALVREVNRRTVRDGQGNVRLLSGDARVLVPLTLADCSISRAFINFPDPWFKARHKKRRLLNPTFMRMLSTKLKAGGDVVITTDDREYRDFVLDSLAAVPAFAPRFTGTHAVALDNYPETKYERKWRGMGREIFYLPYEHRGGASIEREEYVATLGLSYAMRVLEIGDGRTIRAPHGVDA